jgi:hypothetical protein
MTRNQIEISGSSQVGRGVVHHVLQRKPARKRQLLSRSEQNVFPLDEGSQRAHIFIFEDTHPPAVANFADDWHLQRIRSLVASHSIAYRQLSCATLSGCVLKSTGDFETLIVRSSKQGMHPFRKDVFPSYRSPSAKDA